MDMRAAPTNKVQQIKHCNKSLSDDEKMDDMFSDTMSVHAWRKECNAQGGHSPSMCD